ncbi:MAG TPA: ECF-type sigma factor [Thermoanaerobaculia bacterium]|jgi:RNA polymerase sigma factor (TIGR02999 family)
MADTPGKVTRLLRAWSAGDPEALDRLLPLVLDEARDLARRALALESRDHTLQPTALVNEVYLRLVDRRTFWWQDRSQFFSSLAELMRRILVDHARRHRTAKRGGGVPRLRLEEMDVAADAPRPELVELDDALVALQAVDPLRYRIVMLRFFIGLTEMEIARELGLSVNTVGRKWQAARRWLRRELDRAEGRPVTR